jgi:hypothetical protein
LRSINEPVGPELSIKGSRRKTEIPFVVAMVPKGDLNPHGFPHPSLQDIVSTKPNDSKSISYLNQLIKTDIPSSGEMQEN